MQLWKIRYVPQAIMNFASFMYRHVSVGKKTKIYGKVIVKGNGRISIGDGCLINSSIHADPIGGDICVIFRADEGAEISIGNHCGLSNCAVVAQTKVTIADNVLIGAGCKIYDTDFHSIRYDERITMTNVGVKSAPVTICEGAFIGAHAIVLKGVRIGKHSVVGAGSVVTKDIPDGEIWAGNPAHRIGMIDDALV